LPNADDSDLVACVSTSSMINDEESLKSLFIKASQNLNRLQDSSIAQTNVSRQQQVKETVSLLKKCREMVNNLALFSVNEALEDIASNDMQFLLVDSHIALATLLRTDIDREILIKEALDYFNSFMDSLNTHEMLSQSDRQRWEAIKQGVKQKDPARFREEKIARYRREKATKEKMHELQELGDDDELQRELAITTIEFNVQRALDELTSLREEAEMLEYMKKLKTDDEAAYQQCIKETERSRGPNNIGPLMTGEGKVLIGQFVVCTNMESRSETLSLSTIVNDCMNQFLDLIMRFQPCQLMSTFSEKQTEAMCCRVAPRVARARWAIVMPSRIRKDWVRKRKKRNCANRERLMIGKMTTDVEREIACATAEIAFATADLLAGLDGTKCSVSKQRA